MREKITIWFALVMVAILFPYVVTMCVNGVLEQQAYLSKFHSEKTVKVKNQGKEEEMDLEEFLVGVVASEISVDYELEAIKAQAVIARTKALREEKETKSDETDRWSLTYVTKEEMREKWGEKRFLQYYNKVRRAVWETKKQVIFYEDELIDPLYHEVSTGSTVSAKEMYDREVPYLQSVSSSYDVEAKDYMQIKMVSYEEALAILKKDKPQLKWNKESFYEEIILKEKTQLGYVKTLVVGNQTFEGEKIRELFQLNSSNFYIEKFEGKLRFIALGKGHGMGMSQYGANCMAKEEKSYKGILTYYYKNVTCKEGW